MSRPRLHWLLAAGIAAAGCGTGNQPNPVPGTASPSGSIAASTQGPQNPTSTPTPTQDVAVRDGEPWVAFQWISGNGDGIFLVRPDGTGLHSVARDAGMDQIHPDWSPDGHELAFIAVTESDRNELWTVQADGSDARKRFGCDLPCNSLSYPDWSPDGNAIYFGMDANAPPGAPPTTFQVGRLDLATDEVSVVLEREDGLSAEQPRISPDDSQLAYTRFKDEGFTTVGTAIFVANVAGGKERRLTDWELFGAYPDWSPDGAIVFNTRDLGAFQDTSEPANLFTILPDGTGLTQLTTFGSSDTRATQPRWTPDGLGILFTKVDGSGFGTREIAYVAADGSDLRTFTPTSLNGTHPVLRPLPE